MEGVAAKGVLESSEVGRGPVMDGTYLVKG